MFCHIHFNTIVLDTFEKSSSFTWEGGFLASNPSLYELSEVYITIKILVPCSKLFLNRVISRNTTNVAIRNNPFRLSFSTNLLRTKRNGKHTLWIFHNKNTHKNIHSLLVIEIPRKKQWITWRENESYLVKITKLTSYLI